MADTAGPVAQARALVALHEALADVEADVGGLVQPAVDESAELLGGAVGLFVLDDSGSGMRAHAHPHAARHALLREVTGDLERAMHEFVDAVIRGGGTVR